MLIQLQINNIALIDKANVEFDNGLNILTGETGAGKSIIIDSINAILGERFSREMIRSGKERASVEAVFQIDYKRIQDIIDRFGIEEEEDSILVVSREFNISGKNVCRINGRIVTVSVLKELGERIIDVHGQYDNQSLLREKKHLELLDLFGGESVNILKEQYIDKLKEYGSLRNSLKAHLGDEKERQRKIDLLSFQIDEISKADLRIEEEEELNNQKKILSNSEMITKSLSEAYELLYSGNGMQATAFDNVSNAMTRLNGISETCDTYGELSKKLEDIFYQLEDLSHEIRRENEQIEFDPKKLEQIEERMDVIYSLKRKYGNSIAEILEYGKSLANELEDIANNEELIRKLHEKVSNVDNELYMISKKINRERLKAAQVLEKDIGKELEDLEMNNARFKVSVQFNDCIDEKEERPYLASGLDNVEFLISPNAGEPLKPLSKIVSGGEMSRIMLAIKNILANVDRIPTLIFDEIDAGVSGRTAQKVGEKLAAISKNHQVICVTHLAQIAAMADNHLLIKKVSHKDKTCTFVKKLSEDESANEVARILGGKQISSITKQHADEMIKDAQKVKM